MLNQAWSEKKSNNKEERFNILEAVAAIIREDIQSVVTDNSHYPPPGRMFEDINRHIPKSHIYKNTSVPVRPSLYLRPPEI